MEQNNLIYKYYCSTIECLKKIYFKQNDKKIPKNFIPKNKYDKIQYKNSLNNTKNSNGNINSYINNIKNYKDNNGKSKQILEKENICCSTNLKTYLENIENSENENLSECYFKLEMYGKK